MTELQWRKNNSKAPPRKTIFKRWEQGQATREEYQNTAQACWDGSGKGKAELDLELLGYQGQQEELVLLVC